MDILIVCPLVLALFKIGNDNTESDKLLIILKASIVNKSPLCVGKTMNEDQGISSDQCKDVMKYH